MRRRTASGTVVVAMVLGGALLWVAPVAAQDRALKPGFGEKAPLDRALRDDGRIDLSTGFTGTLDPAGYVMEIDAASTPRFVQREPVEASAACDASGAWDDRFFSPGVDGLQFVRLRQALQGSTPGACSRPLGDGPHGTLHTGCRQCARYHQVVGVT